MNDKILKSEGEELSRVLGEVLQAEGRHKPSYGKCTICKKTLWYIIPAGPIEYCPAFYGPCKPFIPLDDYNVAMKHFRAMSEECGENALIGSLWEVYYASGGVKSAIAFTRWLIIEAKPHHYLRAAALCKKEQSK